MRVRLSRLRVKSVLTVFALAHPDGLVDLLFTFAGQVVADGLSVGERLEHSEDLELLAFPGLKVKRLGVFQMGEVCQGVELNQSLISFENPSNLPP